MRHVFSAIVVVLLVEGCAAPRRASLCRHDMPTQITREYTPGSRPDGLIRETIIKGERYIDKAGGGGIFLLTDPNFTGVVDFHTNQPALGGSSTFMTGTATITVDPQTSAVIGAVGTAAGNIIGAAVKSASGKP